MLREDSPKTREKDKFSKPKQPAVHDDREGGSRPGPSPKRQASARPGGQRTGSPAGSAAVGGRPPWETNVIVSAAGSRDRGGIVGGGGGLEERTRPASAPPLETSRLAPPTPATVHRRYTPVYKCSNRLLAKKWDDVAARRHREKIASMKPRIDNASPIKCTHLDQGLKKLRQEQEKAHRIQEENVILLNRMARQLRAPSGFSNVDSRYRLKEPLTKPPPNLHEREHKVHELEEANQLYVQRLEHAAPVYSREAWSDDRRRNLVYLANHTRYPEAYQEEFEREGVELPYNQARYIPPRHAASTVTTGASSTKPASAVRNSHGVGEDAGTDDEGEDVDAQSSADKADKKRHGTGPVSSVWGKDDDARSGSPEVLVAKLPRPRKASAEPRSLKPPGSGSREVVGAVASVGRPPSLPMRTNGPPAKGSWAKAQRMPLYGGPPQ
ncbi:hypothetical protein HKX48_008540 [Thoreauomyces humboldtii]|nr:hypothetical protein HKX48_008540 [Thoreauomyces humboldtii]